MAMGGKRFNTSREGGEGNDSVRSAIEADGSALVEAVNVVVQCHDGVPRLRQ